jgi:hypothetical protein
VRLEFDWGEDRSGGNQSIVGIGLREDRRTKREREREREKEG